MDSTASTSDRNGSDITQDKLLARCDAAGVTSMAARFALVRLARYTNKDPGNPRRGLAWPSIDRLARDLGCKRQTASAALDDLVRAGLVERVRERNGCEPAEYRVVDTTADAQPTSEPIATRWQPKPMGPQTDHSNGSPNGPLNRVAMGPQTDGNGSPNGHAMGPQTDPIDRLIDRFDRQTVSPGPVAAVAAPAGTTAADSPTQGRREAKPSRTARAKAPLPFRALDACHELHRVAPDRFPAVEGRDISQGHAITIERLIRAYSGLSEWTLAGEFLAAGGLGYRTDLGVAWLAKSGRDLMAQARTWKFTGRLPSAPKRSDARATPMPPSASMTAPADELRTQMLAQSVRRGAR